MEVNTATLAFEIGTEELPAFDLTQATKQLEPIITAALQEAHIPYERIEIYSTPRRLIVLAFGLSSTTEALQVEYKGPSSAIAFDEAGNPTKAALGFARGKGVDADSLERRIVGGIEYLFAVKQTPEQNITELLPTILLDVIESISWPKSCRWSTQSVWFSRPVRWLLALLDEQIIPVHYANIEAGNTTQGHRVLSPGTHEVERAGDLLDVLQTSFVVPSELLRREVILTGVTDIEKSSELEARLPEKTLAEVVNLTEYPTPLMGTFDEAFLQVPEEIIVDAMLMHQRYFPLYDKKGELTNKFIIVSNGDPESSTVIVDGNERVVRARLADAKFFFEEDLKTPLESAVAQLDAVIFQESLGSMKEKTERLVVLVNQLAKDIDLMPEETQNALRAAYLCKADLVSNAVIEFTSVQGIMGCYYAKASGENDQVAQAIADHYRPRFAGDEIPQSWVGQLVAIADKLDTICGLFAVGQAPTGSSDPFALRRSAIGIINMLATGLPLSLDSAIHFSLDTYSTLEFGHEEALVEITEFFITRTKVILRDRGFSVDVIDAVLASGVSEPIEIVARVEALQKARVELPEIMGDLAIAYARANNLRDPKLGIEIEDSLFTEVEKSLASAIETSEDAVESALLEGDYATALRELAAMRKPVDLFFERIKIMDENREYRENRLRLLNRFVRAFSQVADFGLLVKKQG